MAISENNKKIAKNTFALYFRSLLGLFIGLYTVRIVLRTLGETDYGIYSVVGALLVLFTFISGTLYTGNQRFLSFYIGRKDEANLKKFFGGSLAVYLIFAVCILTIGELIGVWYVNTHLNINPDRLFAANIVFQLSIISSAIRVIGTPYSSAIMAHEDMHVFGWIAIYDAVVKLLICYLLIISPLDKLISYSFLLAITNIISTLVQIIYAHRRYIECRFKPSWDSKQIKELTSFSGWNLFGSLGWIAKNQGLSLVLNSFFGPIINTAQGIATSVRSYSSTFSNNYGNAVAPQIVKNYAADNRSAFSTLLFRSCKMTFFLMMIIVVPLFFSIDYILQLWIGDHSYYMTIFCQIMLIEALIDSISTPLASANQATGKIAAYQALIGLFSIITLPISYLLLRLGYAPEWAFIVSLVSQIFVVGVRTFFLQRIYPGLLKGALRNIYYPCFTVSLITFTAGYFLRIEIDSFTDWLVVLGLNICICLITIWFLGFTLNERASIKDIIVSKFPVLKKCR